MRGTDRSFLKEFLDQLSQIQGLAGDDLEHLLDVGLERLPIPINILGAVQRKLLVRHA